MGEKLPFGADYITNPEEEKRRSDERWAETLRRMEFKYQARFDKLVELLEAETAGFPKNEEDMTDQQRKLMTALDIARDLANTINELKEE